MQLDIFENSGDVALRNEVILALERRDAAAARRACEALRGEYPHDATLADLAVLAQHLEIEGGAHGPLPDAAAAQQAVCTLEASVLPAAHRVWSAPQAARWLAEPWRQLARRAAALRFDPQQEAVHAAALWLRAGDWPAAAAAVEGIPSWRRIPAPLAWMAEARLHQLGLQASWPLLAELAWLAPARLEALARRAADPQLPQWLARFEASFDGNGEAEDLAWLPAWLLTQRSALAPHLAAAQPGQHQPPEQAFRLLVELLGLERQGRQHDIVARRKALRDLHGGLYAAYMKDR